MKSHVMPERDERRLDGLQLSTPPTLTLAGSWGLLINRREVGKTPLRWLEQRPSSSVVATMRFSTPWTLVVLDTAQAPADSQARRSPQRDKPQRLLPQAGD